MSTITKEQAQKIIEAADEVITALAGTNEDVHPESDSMLRLWDDLNDRYAPPEVVRELARIALASLEAEPVAYIFKHPAGRLFWALTDESNKGQSDVMPVYTAPPAPANAEPVAWLWSHRKHPSEVTLVRPEDDEMAEVSGWSGWSCQALYAAPPAPVSVPAAMEMDDDFDSAFEHGKAVGWNAYRAAMLQSFGNSEQLNSPVIQDGWVACVERMPSAGEKVLAYRPDAPESNDPLIKMATYVGGSAHGHGFDCYCKPTHWMPLPAAPQQED